jgi:hypothetical protein
LIRVVVCAMLRDAIHVVMPFDIALVPDVCAKACARIATLSPGVSLAL